mmetsp:Transcript_22353/g.33417  ORF Transcript_22353/g.33417 Transcript_22353/m.33417 type:complete len:381 (+) Transcript_22353:376-1518(+)
MVRNLSFETISQTLSVDSEHNLEMKRTTASQHKLSKTVRKLSLETISQTSSVDSERNLEMKRTTASRHKAMATRPNSILSHQQAIHNQFSSSEISSDISNEELDISPNVYHQKSISELKRGGIKSTVTTSCVEDFKSTLNIDADVNTPNQLHGKKSPTTLNEQTFFVNGLVQPQAQVKLESRRIANASCDANKFSIQETALHNSHHRPKSILRESRHSYGNLAPQGSSEETTIKRSASSVTFSAPTVHLISGEYDKNMWYTEVDERKMIMGMIRSKMRKEQKKRARLMSGHDSSTSHANAVSSKTGDEEFIAAVNCQTQNISNLFNENEKESKVRMEKPNNDQNALKVPNSHCCVDRKEVTKKEPPMLARDGLIVDWDRS